MTGAHSRGMTIPKTLGAIAGLIVAVGVVLLFGPLSITDPIGGRIECGSVTSPDASGPLPGASFGELALFSQLRGECTAALQDRRTAALSALGVGLVGLTLVGGCSLLLRSRSGEQVQQQPHHEQDHDHQQQVAQ